MQYICISILRPIRALLTKYKVHIEARQSLGVVVFRDV